MTPSSDVETLRAIMAALRNPGTGCAWDRAQTHRSLVPYVLEEAFEVAEAIESGELSDLCEELGDLLLQVVFHARIAEEAGAFSFGDVVRAITTKMVRRHPHVFAREVLATDAAESWEQVKADERAERTGTDEMPCRVLDGVALSLPGLTRAVKLQARASRVGFDWNDARLVLGKIREEADEIAEALDAPVSARRDAAVADEIGDLLFAVANLARHAGVDPETAVRGANAKFERRFAFIEERLEERGTTPARSTLEAMDRLWDEAKLTGL